MADPSAADLLAMSFTGHEALLDVARRWGPELEVDFFQDRGCRADPASCRHCEPEPRPALRIVPNV